MVLYIEFSMFSFAIVYRNLTGYILYPVILKYQVAIKLLLPQSETESARNLLEEIFLGALSVSPSFVDTQFPRQSVPVLAKYQYSKSTSAQYRLL